MPNLPTILPDTLTEPSAYRRLMPTANLARSSRLARRAAVLLLIFLGFTVCMLVFAPWQQNVTGNGSVFAYAPLERQQSIEAPIDGRIVKWGENVQENGFIKEGDLILELEDIDPDLINRLKRQVASIQDVIDNNRSQVDNLSQLLKAAELVVPLYQSQVDQFDTLLITTLEAADSHIDVATQKVRSANQKVSAAKAALFAAKEDEERQRRLYEKRIKSEKEFQAAENKFLKAKADLETAEADLQGAKDALIAKEKERSAKESDILAKLDSIKATLQKTKTEIFKYRSDIDKSQAELNKALKEQPEIESKLAKQQAQEVRAPRDGYILELNVTEGQIVSKKDQICILVPDSADRAVQVWVDGNDAPLIEPGRHVRLQFEGWPAVQFSGWPSVAVGTFGGIVDSVDKRGDGKFRVIVLPDPAEPTWPSENILRLGTRANGWVLLDEVTLGFEVWRQLNGFPPVTSITEPDAKDDKSKKKK